MKNKNCIKLTFTGDIMCIKQEIQAYKTESGEYDFSEIFSDVKNYFSLSDYVIGNLETPLANAYYCNHLINYNSPAAFAEAVKDSGISLVTTANNHCLDRGVRGLEETIKALDTIGLKHTGLNSQNKLPTGIIEIIGNIKIGFLSYTYGTNALFNKTYLDENEKWKVNLYQEQELPKIKKIFRSDLAEKNQSLFNRMHEDINALRNSGAEFIIMCLHAGGQYNFFPLKSTKNITAQIANMDVDAVITNHEHVIHNMNFHNNKFITYSLGNFTSLFCIQTESIYKFSEYSIIVNLYLSKNNNIVTPVEYTFSIAKTISPGKNRVKTVLLFDLINNCTDARKRKKLLKDNLNIYNRFLKRNETKIDLKLEYQISNNSK